MSTFDPVRAAATVAVPPERAWEVFTAGMAGRRPVETHSIAARHDSRPEQLVLEPHEGGEIYENLGGVRRHRAHIRTCEPPARLGYTWHVNPCEPADRGGDRLRARPRRHPRRGRA